MNTESIYGPLFQITLLLGYVFEMVWFRAFARTSTILVSGWLFHHISHYMSGGDGLARKVNTRLEVARHGGHGGDEN